MKTPTLKHRAIVHLAADMRKGAGAHPMARKPGPSVEEWEEEQDLEYIWADHDEAMRTMALELVKGDMR